MFDSTESSDPYSNYRDNAYPIMHKMSYTDNEFYEFEDVLANDQRCNAVQKPWMDYVNKYTLLSGTQKESLDLFFVNNQVRLTRKNIRAIASELKISYKKIINYIYEKNYDHMLIKESPEERCIYDIKNIERELKTSWESYLQMSRYFKQAMGFLYD